MLRSRNGIAVLLLLVLTGVPAIEAACLGLCAPETGARAASAPALAPPAGHGSGCHARAGAGADVLRSELPADCLDAHLLSAPTAEPPRGRSNLSAGAPDGAVALLHATRSSDLSGGERADAWHHPPGPPPPRTHRPDVLRI